MKTLIGVLLYRPSYKTILAQLVQANPGLEADLVLTNDTGMELDISQSVRAAWGSVVVFKNPSDIIKHIQVPISKGKLKHLHFKKIASWQNSLLLYALHKGYDNLIIWEDDQILYVDSDLSEAFFSPQIDTLNASRDVNVCSSRRQGYLHRVPPFITTYIPETVLNVLEQSLCLCNEIVYSGLMTEPAGGFIPYNEASPYGGVEYFGNRPFIYAGSLAINLHTSFPCFYDVPDLPGHNFSRGNDTFFSLGFDNGMVAREVANAYFHDPYMVTIRKKNPADCFAKALECGSVDSFLSLIMGWFSYSGLILRLAFPEEWQSRIREIDSLLKYLPTEFEPIHQVFNQYASRVAHDYTSYANTLDAWRMVCGEIRAHSQPQL